MRKLSLAGNFIYVSTKHSGDLSNCPVQDSPDPESCPSRPGLVHSGCYKLLSSDALDFHHRLARLFTQPGEPDCR